MLLAELVLDQASVDWAQHLPLMLHVIFLGELSVLLDESQNARRNQINQPDLKTLKFLCQARNLRN